MAGCVIRNLKLIAVNVVVVCSFFVLIESVSIDGDIDKIPFENDGFENVHCVSSVRGRFISIMLKRSAAARSDETVNKASSRIRREIQRNKQDELREEYERRLFESLNIIGSISATRLYVPENIQDDNSGSQKKAFNIEIGTVVGRVRKLFPHGKQLIVWPYLGWRNFTVDANTGDVRTTAKMDFELIWLYNMTIRDFRHNYSDPEPLRQPPMPDPEPEDPTQDYVDHYLIVEVVDRNDNVPTFIRDQNTGSFSGEVNTNARAGTPIFYLNPVDDDSGPRGRIRFRIKTDNNEQSEFTIDPKTHFVKTTGQKDLKAGLYQLQIEALDYGMPPKSSGYEKFTVRVGKTPPKFTGEPYNLNFSEADVRGSVVAKVQAISFSGMPIKYEILTQDVKDTFEINHLGEITLSRELDYETANDSDKQFTFQVRATEDTYQPRTQDVTVNLRLLNADDHLGMFKTPAKTLAFEEGSSRTGGEIYAVDVEDCDCQGCTCKRGEMIYKIGDTDGFFKITSDGQIENVKDLDYETQNYFFFPVTVTDPGKNGRTRTSYVEISVLDIDDTAPVFAESTYEFEIFEDAPKDQVIGVVQAIDPDPATKPEDINYKVSDQIPRIASKYFGVEKQGVVKVAKNDDQFKDLSGFKDKYEMKVTAEDQGGKESKPATVTIRIIDVNDHQPVFKDCKEQTIDENKPIGTLVTTLTATDEDRGLNKEIEYGLAQVQKYNFFRIDNTTGQLRTTHVLDREKYDEIFVVAKATDGGASRSDLLRQIGYCQFIVKIKDVNDHHPIFTVQLFEVKVQRDTARGTVLLQVEAVDPDLGMNAIIEYKILSQKIGNGDVNYLEVGKDDGQVKVKSSMSGVDMTDEIKLVIQAYNTEEVKGSVIGDTSETTVSVKFSSNAPPTFNLLKYTADIKEDTKSSSAVMTLQSRVSGVVYALQRIRDRDSLPFFVDSSTGEIKTRSTLDYEREKSYLFAVTAQKQGGQGLASILIEVDVLDVDDVVPIFGNDKYEATVSEAAKAGDNVFRVQASDPDPISGDAIEYRIEANNDYDNFEIVQMTNFAEIKVAFGIKQGFFDREKKSSYTIILEAYRPSSPNLKSTAVLIIDVRDENDSPPVFTKKVYTPAAIPENVPVPYTVPDLVLNATDNDILENADVYYFITSGNDGRFSMETVPGQDQANTGRLIVSRPLDAKKSPEFEKNPVYTLTITATDRKHTATATVTVRVS